MKIEVIKSSAPRPLANYNECFKVGPWVFAAGQIVVVIVGLVAIAFAGILQVAGTRRS